MTTLGRRRFLLWTGTAGVGVGCSSAGGDAAPADGGSSSDAGSPPDVPLPDRMDGPFSAATRQTYVPSPTFPCGIMSGDPTARAIVFWTRVDPELDGGDGAPVVLEVAADPDFSSIVASVEGVARAARDHTVSFDVGGLEPAATYFYRFRAGGETSPLGRTRTAPEREAAIDRARVAWFSCQKWTHGFFTAHHDLSWMAADEATDVDVVLSVGDYVYNKASNNQPRLNAEGEWVTILVEARNDDPIDGAVTHDEYRRKYQHYRSDPNLQAVHANYPFVGVYDNHDGNRPGNSKREGAVAAFFEYMPIRTPPGEPERIHRSFRWGRLVEGWMTDQQTYRNDDEVSDPSELWLLGPDQRSWLLSGMTGSDATWKVMGSQKVFSPFRSADLTTGEPVPSGLAAWDERPNERQAILDGLVAAGTENVMVLSGDAHVFLAFELQTDWDDPAAPYVLTEFLGSGVTSSNFDQRGSPPSADLWPVLKPLNQQHLVYSQLDLNGYGIAEYTPEKATVTFRQPLSITEPRSDTRTLAAFEVDAGSARVRQTEGEPPDRA